MLVITGQISSDRLHKESHQPMDVVAMFAPFTKWSYTIWGPDSIPEMIRKAVRSARSEKPGAITWNCRKALPSGKRATNLWTRAASGVQSLTKRLLIKRLTGSLLPNVELSSQASAQFGVGRANNYPCFAKKLALESLAP